MRIRCTLNGSPRDLDVDPLDRALDMVRQLGLTGTKEGCGEGECGSCTILLDGVPVNSCLVIASQLDGSTIVTIEGLAPGPVLSPLQQAFVDQGATQCGICTPGMLMAAEYLCRELRRWAEHTPGNAQALPRFDVNAIRAWAGPAGDAAATERAVLESAVDQEVRACVSGNICRCTGYESIVRAVKDALKDAAATP